MIEIAMHADGAEHRMRFAGGAMHVKSVRDQAIDDVLNLRVGSALLHYDNHSWLVFPFLLFPRCGDVNSSRFFLRVVAGRIFVHRFTFGAARFIDDALKEPANCGVRKRAAIFALRVLNHFALAIGLIERKIFLLLDLSDLERAMRTLVEQLHEFAIDLIDTAAPVTHVGHGATSRRDKPFLPASFRLRIFAPRACAEASTDSAFSISETSAEPITAASASPPRTETWPGSEIPKPTAIGRFVCDRTRRISAGRSSGMESFAPVTPVREMRYRNPEVASEILSMRSSVEVGAARKTVSRLCAARIFRYSADSSGD